MPVINHIDVREIKKSNSDTELYLVIGGQFNQKRKNSIRVT